MSEKAKEACRVFVLSSILTWGAFVALVIGVALNYHALIGYGILAGICMITLAVISAYRYIHS